MKTGCESPTLREFLSQTRPTNAPVSLRGETQREFRLDVAALSERLNTDSGNASPQGDASPQGEAAPQRAGWVLSVEDRYAFAVGLYALWQTGQHAVLPPNRQAGTIEALSPRTFGVVTDHREWHDHPRALHPLPSTTRSESTPPPEFAPLSSNALAVELYTSGTTGDHRSVHKQLRHLDDEVAELEALFGERAEGAVFVSTASAQHLYGLLFGILWPLATGRPFAPLPRNHASEIVAAAAEHERTVLVSVPSTLRQLARHDGTRRLSGRCRAIFSSGGPLAQETSSRLTEQVSSCPIEIFGSTETGGVAFRQLEAANNTAEETNAWTPFPSVAISQGDDESLVVCSRFVTRPNSDITTTEPTQTLEMGDRIQLFSNGRFRLIGRVDQVVKIGEKRVDLAAMEALLRNHDEVEDAALTPVMRKGVARIGAVVVPVSFDPSHFDPEIRDRLKHALHGVLIEHFDPVVVPRSWRFLAALPTNARGKTPRAALRALFEKEPAAPVGVDRPEVRNEIRLADGLEREARVPSDLPCFDGHFPGLPVVPGYLQLDWALDAAASLLGREPEVAAIESLKLISPLRPGKTFRILVRCSSETRLSIEITSEEAIHAKGRVRLAPHD